MVAEQVWHGLFQMPQIAIVMGCLVGCFVSIAGVVSYYWFRAQKERSENELKRTLVDRGLSVEEIERIIGAKAEESSD